MFDIQDVIAKLGQFGAIPYFSREISDTLMTILLPRHILALKERKMEIERHIFAFLPSLQNMDYFSRLNLRLLIGLPVSFEEDSGAIKTLEGAISGVTRKKMDVAETLRRIRDNE